MKGLEFPILGTKVVGLSRKFDLSSPSGRKEYFEAKVGDEIRQLQKFLKNRSFIAYFLGKKNSGKGTYSKLFTEIFGEEKVVHISVGDVVRDYHSNWNKFVNTKEYKELQKIYRGYISFEEAVERFVKRSTEKLLPSEFILALLKLDIKKHEGKSIFIDGLPREMDQVSYSLYFRDLINYRDDPDLFILIDIPESVIAERIKTRVICPSCQTSRSMKFLVTSKAGYDEKKKEFYLICDNPKCEQSGKARMVPKEGDELGIEPIRPRLIKDEDLLKTAFSLHGVPKILLRNHVPVSEAEKNFENYEFSPDYQFAWNKKTKEVKITEKAWTVEDDNGVNSYSLLAPAVVVSLIKQLAEVLV